MLCQLSCLAIAIAVGFPIFLNQAYNKFPSDLTLHLLRTERIISGEFHLPHPLYHYFTYFTYQCLHWIIPSIDLFTTGAIVNVGLVVTIAIVLYAQLKRNLSRMYAPLEITFFTFFLMISTAIYWPWFNTYFYLGQWSPNIWHSPTMFAVKPIVLLCFFGIVRFFLEPTLRSNVLPYLVLGGLMALSAVAKPSFAFSFLPAIGVFVLAKHFGNWKTYGQTILLFLPVVLVLIYQFLATYMSEIDSSQPDLRDRIVFTFFGVFNLYTPSVLVSSLLVLAFPISVLVMFFKTVKTDSYLLIAWLNTAVAFSQAAFLAEKNKFHEAAFAFGYCIALFLLFICSFLHFLNLYKSCPHKRFDEYRYGLCVAMMVLHVGSGLLYLVKIANGGDYV